MTSRTIKSPAHSRWYAFLGPNKAVQYGSCLKLLATVLTWCLIKNAMAIASQRRTSFSCFDSYLGCPAFPTAATGTYLISSLVKEESLDMEGDQATNVQRTTSIIVLLTPKRAETRNASGVVPWTSIRHVALRYLFA